MSKIWFRPKGLQYYMLQTWPLMHLFLKIGTMTPLICLFGKSWIFASLRGNFLKILSLGTFFL